MTLAPMSDGPVGVVTGAAGGIGRAVCERMAGLGWRVLCVDAEAPAGNAVVGALRSAGADARFAKADVSQSADVERYVATALKEFGRIDGLVNNAGIEGAITAIPDYPIDVFDRVVAVNLRGVFLGMKHVLPVMTEQGAGAVVNIASVAGLVGHPYHGAYVASKHGVVGLTKVAAAEVGGHGIRVNAVCPGPTSTRMIASIEEQLPGSSSEQAHRRIAEKIPLKRYGHPDEIARTVMFLLTDDASYINGAALTVDGGFIAAI
jgi:NAD(P)-dependent dehydrogenase (short-subunit alcohol dehydrogenase family)